MLNTISVRIITDLLTELNCTTNVNKISMRAITNAFPKCNSFSHLLTFSRLSYGNRFRFVLKIVDGCFICVFTAAGV